MTDLTELPFHPQPKPRRTRKAERREIREHERKLIREVRKADVRRDGYCIHPTDPRWPHEGRSEMAHLEEMRRAKTVGQKPEQRHSTWDTAMMCDRHHDDYDNHDVEIEFASPVHRANGVIRFYRGSEFIGASEPPGVKRC